MKVDTSSPHRRLDERRAIGAEWRRKAPLEALADWKPPADRPDPIQILIEQGKSRIEELLPVRYARMKADPFAFLRGAAAIMAADLAEWDVKRLGASLVTAGQAAAMSGRDSRRLARTAAHSYREHLARLARLAPFDAWSTRIDLATAIADIDSTKIRQGLEKRLAAVLAAGAEHFGLVEEKKGSWRIREKPPLVRHLSRHELHAHKAFASYAESLQEDRRVLLQRYHLHDIAFKVVGVGSIGTFCAIGLFMSDGEAPLLLQIKEAQQSVLAPFAGASDYPNHGERVVVGQRMLQAATDVFLGWTKIPLDGRYLYVRRLKDQRLSGIGARLAAALPFYAALCGRTLARGHARAGDAVAISAYLGDGSEFDKAIAQFATAYAEQTERDWRALLEAIKLGRISVAQE